ncbi:MAG: Enoyl-[acyl-carrier-protein] reductase [NADH] FabI [Candidatus Anoxychlamydiales bacterium]|nr:Enoyl-[acyl-carrier-protein] reductase [NADH] FabI [Candidatus Anoxychlamydiales bacterium]
MLNIDLKGKKAFVAGIGDDQGFGFQIAKTLYEAGCEVIIGTWAPIFNIFLTSWERKKFDESRKLKDGTLFNFLKVYPIDAAFDTMDEVPEEIKENKRYKKLNNYALKEVAKLIEKDYGKIDILVHSLANAPEVTKPLLETSRKGYLSALSASSYSFVSLVKYFAPIMNKNGSALGLSYVASTKAIPGYGGGMSSAKAALESDIRTLSYEAGRKYNIRLNCISAGPLRSRAAKAIGMIDNMIKYSHANAPLQKDLLAEDVAYLSAFLSSNLASSITGDTIFVDNGLHVMGMAVDSKSIND